MLPDKKSTSFTWLQGTKRLTSEGDKSEKVCLREECAMEVDSPPPTPSTSSVNSESSKENKQQKVKRMTRMGASSLIRRTSTSGKNYRFIEQDLQEEDEFVVGTNNVSDSSKGSTSSFSLGRKFNKTFKDVKISIGNLSQRLRRSTRRRYALGETASVADLTPTRRILGRTPTKLYSPFGFDSPITKQPNRRYNPPTTPMMSRKVSLPGPVRLYNTPLDKDKKSQTRVGLRANKNSPITRQSFRF